MMPFSPEFFCKLQYNLFPQQKVWFSNFFFSFINVTFQKITIGTVSQTPSLDPPFSWLSKQILLQKKSPLETNHRLVHSKFAAWYIYACVILSIRSIAGLALYRMSKSALCWSNLSSSSFRCKYCPSFFNHFSVMACLTIGQTQKSP